MQISRRLAHPGWVDVVLPLALAIGSTFTPGALRTVLLIAAIAAVGWTFHNTELAGRRWKRTGVAIAVATAAAIVTFFVGRIADARIKPTESVATPEKSASVSPLGAESATSTNTLSQSTKNSQRKSKMDKMLRPKGEPALAQSSPQIYGTQHVESGGTGYQANGPEAHIDVQVNPSVEYVEPDADIKGRLSRRLAGVRSKYDPQLINVMLAPEAGNSQRQRVARFIGLSLGEYGLGYFSPSLTFMGNFPDNPITMVCAPSDVSMADDILDALTPYIPRGVVKPMQDFRPRPGCTMELYIYGTPTFTKNGYADIR